MKRFLLLIVILLLCIQAEACRFTIREIAYSSLLLEKYKLVLHADSLEHKQLINDFKSIAFAYTLDANVEYEFLQDEIKFPSIRFLSEEGLELHHAKVERNDNIIEFITSCLVSPLRKQIIEGIGDTFAIIFYLEGEGNSSGEHEAMIKEVTEQFELVSPHLDKIVSEEIKLIKLSLSDRTDETILLNTLGVDETNRQPLLAIIYGRGRMAGNLLVGNEITAKRIFNKLVLMGTDCECGINLSPLLERTLPLNWPNKLRQEITKMLDFDVDNPIIMAEMSRILAKGAANNQADLASIDAEIFEIKKKSETPEVNKYKTINSKVLSHTIIVLIILIALVLIGGLIVYYLKRS